MHVYMGAPRYACTYVHTHMHTYTYISSHCWAHLVLLIYTWNYRAHSRGRLMLVLCTSLSCLCFVYKYGPALFLSMSVGLVTALVLIRQPHCYGYSSRVQLPVISRRQSHRLPGPLALTSFLLHHLCSSWACAGIVLQMYTLVLFIHVVKHSGYFDLLSEYMIEFTT